MCICTFFGHRDCPSTIEPVLRSTIIDLIETQHIDTFYVGHQGAFDSLVRSVLIDLAAAYPQIHYAVVLAQLPTQRGEFDTRDFSDTLLPEGIEHDPPRYAINWRNEWMLKQASHVITYVTYPWGGAAKFAEKAIRSQKTVINLAEKHI